MTRLRWACFALVAVGGTLSFVLGARNRLLPCVANWLDVGETPRRADFVLPLGGDLNTRPFVAAALLKCGFANKVLVPRVPRQPEAEERIVAPHHELVARILMHRGVPIDKIMFLGERNDSTYDEAQSLHEFLRNSPASRVIIVTSFFHTRRARWIFARVLGESMKQVSFGAAPWEGFNADTWWWREEGFCFIVLENLKFGAYLVFYGGVVYWITAAVIIIAMAFAWIKRRHNSYSVGEALDADAA